MSQIANLAASELQVHDLGIVLPSLGAQIDLHTLNIGEMNDELDTVVERPLYELCVHGSLLKEVCWKHWSCFVLHKRASSTASAETSAIYQPRQQYTEQIENRSLISEITGTHLLW